MSQQHVVIIGGTSGIGLATAEILLRENFRVTISGRDSKRLADANNKLGNKANAVAVDATDSSAVAALFTKLGHFDHLVLAFGSNKGLGPFRTVDANSLRQGFNEKVVSQFACAQAAYEYLNPTGSIIFLSSVSGVSASPGAAGIGAVNAAIASLVPTLAKELQPLRINAVAPGVIDTPWWSWCPPEEKSSLFADFATKTPAGRIGTPEDIAHVILFLVMNSFITGQAILCDGGIHLS